MSASDSCIDGASKSNNDDLCDVNNMLQNTYEFNATDDGISICANCSKQGISDNMNTCNKCKTAKYCNAVCKKVHKKKHKKDCEEHQRRAAKLHDEELFKQPPSQYGDCQICFLRIPSLDTSWAYKVCCGKMICSGCEHAPVYDNHGNKVDNRKCPFCRTSPPKSRKEATERRMKRIEAGDAQAMSNQGCAYFEGAGGTAQNSRKALELWRRAAELGYARAYTNIGWAYGNGIGSLEVDKEKEIYYYELAAMAGNEVARNQLGVYEEDEGNMNRALKHHMIAVRYGYTDSLERIKNLYSKGFAMKGDYMK